MTGDIPPKAGRLVLVIEEKIQRHRKKTPVLAPYESAMNEWLNSPSGQAWINHYKNAALGLDPLAEQREAKRRRRAQREARKSVLRREREAKIKAVAKPLAGVAAVAASAFFPLRGIGSGLAPDPEQPLKRSERKRLKSLSMLRTELDRRAGFASPDNG